ncbi:MAG TPA: RsmD family RNA methyltransferase [Fimbriimonadaceae bacterium]|nr:RsmD family RNA methyltransferase [Fimbriimonadaceae bacterium]
MIVLSHFQAEQLLRAREAASGEAGVSLDLERTKSRVVLTPEGAQLSESVFLSWEDAEEIADSETACFLVDEDGIHKIAFFSEEFNRYYSLRPTKRAPTMLVGGFPMHRIKDIDPHTDTLNKIATVGPIRGDVLDTTTGLGYTAIEAARKATSVTTIELDPTVIEICRFNPWSQELFTRDNIERLTGDAYELVQDLPGGKYTFIFHDPPTFKLAGQLYSSEFYAHLLRLLRRGGKLFHYTGDLNSGAGATVVKGATRRLREIGFKKVDRHPEAFGLVAHK